MTDKIFAKGIYIDKPHENAPDFVKGKVGIKVDEAIQFLKEHENARGYVNLDLLQSKEGKLYFELNDWVPEDMKEKSEHMDFNETHRPDQPKDYMF